MFISLQVLYDPKASGQYMNSIIDILGFETLRGKELFLNELTGALDDNLEKR